MSKYIDEARQQLEVWSNTIDQDTFNKQIEGLYPQVVYKLKHIHTGLFFDPQRYEGNVSKQGKVYSNKKPPRQSFIKIPHGVDIENGYDVSQLPQSRHLGCYKTELSDWVVVEYELKEIK